ncbi:hypothetical protein V5O48_010035 [Marasmius crinis-equi]|uniref:Uncharacterized protein n=1 Tax=Marasmius crinis-equi TaxID=585013 RepID=A0ABR3FA39_9AGAR
MIATTEALSASTWHRDRFKERDDAFSRHLPSTIQFDGSDILHSIDVHRRFPDFVKTVSLLWGYRLVADISDFLKIHPSVIFGTVIHLKKPGKLYYLPPNTILEPRTAYADDSDHRGADSYSTPTYGRLCLRFGKHNINGLDAQIVFGVRDRDGAIGPFYLFLGIKHPQRVNGLLRLDTSSLFKASYWSLDPDGSSKISQTRLKDYGIPDYHVDVWIGSSWKKPLYAAVQDYLRLENQDPIQYAMNHGYPIFQEWDKGQFEVRNEEQSKEDEGDDYGIPIGVQVPTEYIASPLECARVTDISDFIKIHPSITFGTVIHLKRPGILYHLHPSPLSNFKWYYGTNSDDSTQPRATMDLNLDHGRLPLTFNLDGAFAWFDIVVPSLQCIQPAYLSQMSVEDEHSWEDLVLINSISFYLRGDFTADPSTFLVPVFLFHRMARKETGNRFDRRDISSLSEPFYWSLDLDGDSSIPKERLEDYGIPKCDVFMRVGSCWDKAHYAAFRDHFRLVNEHPIQYARNRGYPIFQKWNERRSEVANEDQDRESETDPGQKEESQGDDDKWIPPAVQSHSNMASLYNHFEEEIDDAMDVDSDVDPVDDVTDPKNANNHAFSGDTDIVMGSEDDNSTSTVTDEILSSIATGKKRAREQDADAGPSKL